MCVLRLPDDRQLLETAVEDIWGVGPGNLNRLQRLGLYTALDVARANPQMVRKHLRIFGEKLVYELRGIDCAGLPETEEDRQARKTILASRSFGEPVADLAPLMEAVAEHIATAAAKLRQDESLAGAVVVFIRSNRFRPADEQMSLSGERPVAPTQNTPELVRAALEILHDIYRPGYRYAKAGVMLGQIQPLAQQQETLFEPRAVADPLMAAMDALNRKFSKTRKKALVLGAEGLVRSWQAKSARRSPDCLHDWAQLPVVRA